MKYIANSPNDYMDQLPQKRREVIEKIRAVIKQNLPQGFEEQLSYGMLGYVVPHSLYPAGYHVNPELPLPFINVASQKNFVALYHSGIYANTNLLEWFVAEYPKHSTLKLNMGKSCIRFKNLNDIPYKLIAELCTKMTTKEWITLCEKNVKK
tara:strand:- start:2644 stop:3099 length:456 start_codon:yes stop_codon:yes gene_type:complete